MLGSPTIDRQEAQNPSLDLRKGFRRDVARTLVDRAAFLPEPDRYLVEGVFRDGRPISDLAAMWREIPGHERVPRALRHRLHRLVERLLSPRFEVVARLRHTWTPTRTRIATACVLHGLSTRQASERLNVSLHTVRRQLDAVHAICDAVSGSVKP
ncbi:MAG: hypothetical protein HND58_18245 [Planctomycetota bacterium]|nr:MAG: hypothetical protein HND58_18245 [Planctomycetota bacterium]